MAWNAILAVWSEEAQKRLTVVPGTRFGSPASRAARRARFIPCFSCGKPQPTMTSTISFGSRPCTCSTASRIANASRSSGRTSTNDPLPARPIGVRTALTMTASGTRVSLGEGARSGKRTADDQRLDLARALVQRGNARVAQVFRDRVFVDVPVAAEDLHR